MPTNTLIRGYHCVHTFITTYTNVHARSQIQHKQIRFREPQLLKHNTCTHSPTLSLSLTHTQTKSSNSERREIGWSSSAAVHFTITMQHSVLHSGQRRWSSKLALWSSWDKIAVNRTKIVVVSSVRVFFCDFCVCLVVCVYMHSKACILRNCVNARTCVCVCKYMYIHAHENTHRDA